MFPTRKGSSRKKIKRRPNDQRKANQSGTTKCLKGNNNNQNQVRKDPTEIFPEEVN